MTAKDVKKWLTTWKWMITVTNTGSALHTPTARRMLRGCRRGNQVLIFHSEAVLPLEPLVVSLYTATCRVRWQEHTNESVPDSMSHGTPVETALPQSLLTTTLLSDLLRGIDSCVPRGGYYRLAWRTFCVHPLSAACILSLMLAFDNLIWPHLDTYNWPQLINKDAGPVLQSLTVPAGMECRGRGGV